MRSIAKHFQFSTNIDLCKKLGIGIDEDLFIRAIIGLKYKEGYEATNKIQVIKNAMICLLNGDLIDVDKLDYVIRDAYVTGYNSLTLDLERLLAGYTIVETTDHSYEVAFKKGALSVIENVIYANDLERRWIQSHPAILYDCWLVEGLLVCFDEYAKRRIMEAAQAKKDKPASVPALRTIYTKEALSAEGISEGDYKLRLLCDDDIICYGKNIDDPREDNQQSDFQDQQSSYLCVFLLRAHRRFPYIENSQRSQK